MARKSKKKFPYGWTPERIHEYFVKLAAETGRPFGTPKKPLQVSDIPRGAFISHAYSDKRSKDTLLAMLPPDFEPLIWEPITVPPTDYVSTPLVEAVRAAPALIYIAEGDAVYSFWVAFERDVALRSRKPVFACHPSRREFVAERKEPASLLIHGVYGATDLPVAEELIGWMAEHRDFRVERFSPFDWNDSGEYAAEIAEFSGLFLAVVGKNTIHELPLQNVRLACDSEDYGIVTRLVIACLDPPDAWIPKHVTQFLIKDGLIDLTDGGRQRPWSANRVDDLIARIVWLSR